MKNSRQFKTLLIAAFVAMSAGAFAQVKIGSNPIVIGPNNNLEVEATNGNKTVIQKDNGNVGIGTTTPGNKAEINSGTANTSGLRFTNLNDASGITTNTNYQTLGVDINGDVVTVPSASSTILTGSFVVGDISSVSSGSRPVSGFITGTTVLGGVDGPGNQVLTVSVTFPSVGTSDYTVSLTQIGGAANLSGNLINGNAFVSSPLVYNKTATGFTVYLLEYKQIAQNAGYDVILAK